MKEKSKKTKKKMKKGLVIGIVIGVIVVIGLLIAIIGSISKSMNEAMKKMEEENNTLFTVEKKEVEQEIRTSGTVIGVDKNAYVSPVTAKVKDICVEVGQTVKKGDVLLTYDESDLGSNLDKVLIQAQVERATGNESFEMEKKATQKVSAAKKKVKGLKEDIRTLKKEIKKLSNDAKTYEKQMQAGETIDQKKYQKTVTDLKVKNKELASKQGKIAEQEGIIATNKEIKVSDSSKAQINASNQLTNMNINEAQDSLDAAKAGIVAQEDGIVESIMIEKGAYASETQTVMSIIDENKIGVEFSISKDDLGSISKGQKARIVISGNEYTGKVDFISRVASLTMPMENGKNGGNADIRGRIVIDQPDEQIFIGVSAKVFIFVGKVDNALVIPYSALNTDSKGDYVFVVNDENLIERKDVTLGIYSDEYYEVIEGIDKGDKVITEVTSDMKPGDEYMGSNPMGMKVPE